MIEVESRGLYKKLFSPPVWQQQEQWQLIMVDVQFFLSGTGSRIDSFEINKYMGFLENLVGRT